jgi:hypothetical protein
VVTLAQVQGGKSQPQLLAVRRTEPRQEKAPGANTAPGEPGFFKLMAEKLEMAVCLISEELE